jgi:hypothetical protein
VSLERRIQAGCENVVEVTVECTEGEGRAPQEKAVGKRQEKPGRALQDGLWWLTGLIDKVLSHTWGTVCMHLC